MYIAITCEDPTYTAFETFDAVVQYIIIRYLTNIQFSPCYLEETKRSDGRLKAVVLEAFLEKISSYVERMPELKCVVNSIIDRELIKTN